MTAIEYRDAAAPAEVRSTAQTEGAAGFDATLIPWYTLDDRGTFFLPGSAGATASSRAGTVPHLWQHNPDEPIGKHRRAAETGTGFRITVEVNQGTERGAELMSNLRFGVPLGVSVGFERIRDRPGDEADDAKLDRSTAPEAVRRAPIGQLRAITAFRWWESSSVTFPGIAAARPDAVRSWLDPAVEADLERERARRDREIRRVLAVHRVLASFAASRGH